MNIDWSKIEHFTEDEFPDNPNLNADPFLIYSLDKFRDLLKNKVYPSPVPGALARFDDGANSSRHYAVGRKSDAIDVFCDTTIFHAWSIALRSGLWGGIGIYFDTYYCNKPWCMLHLDKRNYNALWLRENKKYMGTKSDIFWLKLNKLFNLMEKE